MKIPSSYDIIGSILLLPEKTKEAKKLAKLLLKKLKNIETVAIKTDIHKGKFRLKKTKTLAGKRTKITIHKENNIKLKLNIDTCYFSPRLSSERLRIAKQVKEGESILCMFSGISPYSCVIARNSKPKEIYDIELNKQAIKFARENIQLNKLDNIKILQGDVSKVLPKIKKRFDRIIMPLPKNASSFLDIAIKKLKKDGVIHFYDFQLEKDIPSASIKKIKQFCKPEILKIVKCGQYSPRKYRLCIDFKLKK